MLSFIFVLGLGIALITLPEKGAKAPEGQIALKPSSAPVEESRPTPAEEARSSVPRMHLLDDNKTYPPISIEEAVLLSNLGLKRSSKSGYSPDGVVPRNVQEAASHLKRYQVFIGYPRFGYALELEDWYVFTGYTGVLDPEALRKLEGRIFQYGWGVNKESGKIVFWGFEKASE